MMSNKHKYEKSFVLKFCVIIIFLVIHTDDKVFYLQHLWMDRHITLINLTSESMSLMISPSQPMTCEEIWVVSPRC